MELDIWGGGGGVARLPGSPAQNLLSKMDLVMVCLLIFLDVLSVRVPPAELNISAFPLELRNWVIKGLGMSSLVYATGHIKDPVPLIGKRRGLSPGGRFPPSFIHQVIIITGLNKLYNCMFSP